MANSIFTYPGTGGQYTFASPPYLDEDHLFVYIDGVLQTKTTNYTISGDSITFVGSPPGALTTIKIKRVSSPTTRLVSYSNGSPFSESDLDLDSTQLFYLQQEAIDQLGEDLTLSADLTVSGDATFVDLTASGDVSVTQLGVADNISIYEDGSGFARTDFDTIYRIYERGTGHRIIEAGDSAAYLCYNSGYKLATTADGIEVYNSIQNNSGDFNINSASDVVINGNGTVMFRGFDGGAAVMYHNGISMIYTTITGVTVSGSCTTTGAVDAASFSVSGTPGASGSFTAQSGETITVVNGLITSIV